MPVGEWEEVARCCAQIASFPPATPFSALGGEGSPARSARAKARPWRCLDLARYRAGRFTAPTGNFQANELGLRIIIDCHEGGRDSDALAAQLQYAPL